MKFVNTKARNWLASGAVAAGAALSFPAFAMDIDSGEWGTAPDGVNMLLLYAQHVERSELYSGGRKVLGDAKLTSDVGIARFVHWMQIGDYVMAPQALLPAGHLIASGNVAALGSTTGVGDIIFASPFWLVHDNAEHKAIVICPYLIAPTGDYDRNRGLNLGENRWKGDLQLGTSYGFTKDLGIELTGDIEWFGKNDKVGPAAASMTQKPTTEVQAYLNWYQAPGTTFALGVARTDGGETTVAGVRQNDRSGTTKASLTASKFVGPKTQLLVTYGRDLSVQSGFKEQNRLNIRFLQIF